MRGWPHLADNATQKREGHLRFGLQLKVLATLAVLFTIVAAASFAWMASNAHEQGLRGAEDQAIALSDQMDAVWDYVDENQPATNVYVRELGEQARGLVCVSAVKSIARQFSRENETEISVVSLSPRNKEDAADAFEQQALQAFAADETLGSYAGVGTGDDGEKYYYYLRPRRITAACLACHGDPAGEKDPLGYEKEGYTTGMVAGAISIRESLGAHTAAAQANTLQGIGLFLVGLLAVMGAMYAVLRKTVIRPVARVSDAASAYHPGKDSPRIAQTGGTDEIAELARDFNAMADDLDSLYGNLEFRVEERTAELERLNGELQAKQDELAHALEQLKDETEYKDRLFASLSHDLRTPLASIIAYTQLADTQMGSHPSDEHDSGNCRNQQTIAQIGEQARTLVGMVDNILAFARAESRGIELHPTAVDLVDLAMHLRSTMEPIAMRRGQNLEVKADANSPLIEADRDLLMRVLQNLANNASKFTPAGGHIWVRIGCDPQDDPERHTISFVVEDDGVGIAADELERIFDPYTKGAYREGGNRNGAGLGLAVIRQIADAMQGEVSAQQREAGGSRFIFRFPATVLDEEDFE
ncbi:MAG: DUF3365 domain-containing protein [Coriobacteriaceae bacterium]|nr:DUF3365 domain-containing protein [Coriobacteriaceae bacterium]